MWGVESQILSLFIWGKDKGKFILGRYPIQEVLLFLTNGFLTMHPRKIVNDDGKMKLVR
jgi:hypothetical protein